MADFISCPDRALKYCDQLSNETWARFGRFSEMDFIRFAKAAHRVIVHNQAYMRQKNQLNLDKLQLGKNQATIAISNQVIRNGLDMCDFKRGLLYQGDYSASLRDLRVRIEKMAAAYGFALDGAGVTDTQSPQSIFRVFDFASIRSSIRVQKIERSYPWRRTVRGFAAENRQLREKQKKKA